MSKFKVGDKVRRTAGYHGGMQIGDTGIVTCNTVYGIKIDDYRWGWHDEGNFGLVPRDKYRVTVKFENGVKFKSNKLDVDTAVEMAMDFADLKGIRCTRVTPC